MSDEERGHAIIALNAIKVSALNAVDSLVIAAAALAFEKYDTARQSRDRAALELASALTNLTGATITFNDAGTNTASDGQHAARAEAGQGAEPAPPDTEVGV